MPTEELQLVFAVGSAPWFEPRTQSGQLPMPSHLCSPHSQDPTAESFRRLSSVQSRAAGEAEGRLQCTQKEAHSYGELEGGRKIKSR